MPQFRRDSRATLRRRIGRLMHRDEFVYGTVIASPAPSASEFTLMDAQKFGSDHFIGRIAYAVSGTGAGQSSYVSDSESGTGKITVAPSLSTTFDTTTVVEIWPDGISPDAVNDAINLAIDDAGDRIFIYAETTSPTLDADREVITIPVSYTKLVNVKYLDSGGRWVVYRYSHNPDLPRQEQGRDFTIVGRSIYLSDSIPSDIAGPSIMVSGYELPAHPALDTDLVGCPPAYIIFKASGNLEQSETGNVDVDPEGHGTRGAQWLAQAQRILTAGNWTIFQPNTINLDI